MILMYHKIHPESPTKWWVTPNAFWRQLEELRSYKVVSLADYDPKDPSHAVITFDGVYENVYQFALPLLKKFGYPFELFVAGDTIGRGNEFDQSEEPPARFADSEQLGGLVAEGGRLQWHSASHRDLSKISDEKEILRELSVPDSIRSLDPAGFSWFAYPYGKHPDRVVDLARKRYRGALSCVEGNDADPYRLNRITVTNETSFRNSSVSLIIANYNYGHYAAEAIESALRQTIEPEEILFIDDCSDDNSMDVASRYNDRICIVRNESNLGIIENFNKAVSLTNGQYICFLGADNRFRSDYVEKCQRALDANPEAAVAYTDMSLFGPRAGLLAAKIGAILAEPSDDVFQWRMPPFNDKTRKTLKEENFIHGSSMYRRSAFEGVGGYRKSDGPEDHNLFCRMIDSGWDATHVPELLLEYRQHSSTQANTELSTAMEIAHLRKSLRASQERARSLESKLEDARVRMRKFEAALQEFARSRNINLETPS